MFAASDNCGVWSSRQHQQHQKTTTSNNIQKKNNIKKKKLCYFFSFAKKRKSSILEWSFELDEKQKQFLLICKTRFSFFFFQKCIFPTIWTTTITKLQWRWEKSQIFVNFYFHFDVWRNIPTFLLFLFANRREFWICLSFQSKFKSLLNNDIRSNLNLVIVLVLTKR